MTNAREELVRDVFERWNAGERNSTMRIFSGHERALEAAGLA